MVTRPLANNGFGFDSAFVRREIKRIERLFVMLPDVPSVYDEWKWLVSTYAVIGNKVHAARLVASMHIHGVRSLLTFNTDGLLG